MKIHANHREAWLKINIDCILLVLKMYVFRSFVFNIMCKLVSPSVHAMNLQIT